MIYIINDNINKYTIEIVKKALSRSFTKSQVKEISDKEIDKTIDLKNLAIVLISPTDKLFFDLIRKRKKKKILLLGKLTKKVAEYLGFYYYREFIYNDIYIDFDYSNQKLPYSYSKYFISYNQHDLVQNIDLYPIRFFERYDFENEWNNLGYGKITTNKNPYSIQNFIEKKNHNSEVLSYIYKLYDNNKFIFWENELKLDTANSSIDGIYSIVYNDDDNSILWFNREVGPVDSLEWKIVEKFFSDYLYQLGFPCIYRISEIPVNYHTIVTMRLDCDEDILSSRYLFEFYKSRNIPFSLAIKTSLDLNQEVYSFLTEVIKNNGSIVSHSHQHKENWGENEDAAYSEALKSKKIIEELLSIPVDYAVSPFHQNPEYAIRALKKAGYSGFIGGIIKNDPEYLMGVSGEVPFVDGIISLSQQCMLHGDCYHRQKNNLSVYKRSFEHYYKNHSIFGYLDHPFSNRYSYGWINEEERMNVHKELIDYISSKSGIIFLNLNDCLNLIKYRTNLRIEEQKGRPLIKNNTSNYKFKIIGKNEEWIQ